MMDPTAAPVFKAFGKNIFCCFLVHVFATGEEIPLTGISLPDKMSINHPLPEVRNSVILIGL